MTSDEHTSREELQAAAFYDTAASRYDAEVDSTNNLTLRDHFRRRVSALAGAGGTILDFGCGTGTDAAWYAMRGHRTLAYDISPGMVDVLRRRCVREIADGTVIAMAGGLNRLESELDEIGPLAAVAANFAVLNHISDLRPVFRMFASHLASDGVVVASVLNPFYWPDMKRRWWWRNFSRSFGTDAIRFAGDVTTYRHFVTAITKMAAPAFILAERNPTWRDSLFANFLLLVLRKRD
jgi:SAM-dependent methyltransferase